MIQCVQVKVFSLMIKQCLYSCNLAKEKRPTLLKAEQWPFYTQTKKLDLTNIIESTADINNGCFRPSNNIIVQLLKKNENRPQSKSL